LGFQTASEYLRKRGRPLAALAACELRSPAPLTLSEFISFNQQYVSLQKSLGFSNQIPCPIGRSNLAPLHHPPAEPVLFAFSFTVPNCSESSVAIPGTDFVISGKPEYREGKEDGIVARGDVSPDGLRQKAAFVVKALREQVESLGAQWGAITGAQVYTVHSLEPLISSVFADNGLTDVGLTLFPSYPPVLGLEFEVDVRSVTRELFI
jgi:hypothetical protein